MKTKNSGFSDRNRDEEKSPHNKKKMKPQTKGDKYPLKNRFYEDEEDDDLENYKYDEDDDFPEDDDD